jgi:hypothetical protein
MPTRLVFERFARYNYNSQERIQNSIVRLEKENGNNVMLSEGDCISFAPFNGNANNRTHAKIVDFIHSDREIDGFLYLTYNPQEGAWDRSPKRFLAHPDALNGITKENCVNQGGKRKRTLKNKRNKRKSRRVRK